MPEPFTKKRIVECVPNFSEGRRPQVIRGISEAIASVPGVRVIHVESDPSHNRSVITFAAYPESAVEAAVRGARAARDSIDLNAHGGEHPRMGAMDVCPFVPLQGVTLEECVQLAKETGRRLWEELGIPAYLYEAAALRPDRANLANVRNQGFEAIREAVKTCPDRAPDIGGPLLHPTAGATAVGARRPLVAYNVDLTTDDVSIARKIAHAVRERDGGLKNVKALGFFIQERGCAQVSMNLTDVHSTGMHRAFEFVRREASRYGVGVRSSEIIGLVPRQAVVDAAAWELQIDNLSDGLILEDRIRQAFESGEDESPEARERTEVAGGGRSDAEGPDGPDEDASPRRIAARSGFYGCALLLKAAAKAQGGMADSHGEYGQQQALPLAAETAVLRTLQGRLWSLSLPTTAENGDAFREAAFEAVRDCVDALEAASKAFGSPGAGFLVPTAELAGGVLQLSTALSASALLIQSQGETLAELEILTSRGQKAAMAIESIIHRAGGGREGKQ